MEIFKGTQSHSGRVRGEKRQCIPTRANTHQYAPTRIAWLEFKRLIWGANTRQHAVIKPGIDCAFAMG